MLFKANNSHKSQTDTEQCSGREREGEQHLGHWFGLFKWKNTLEIVQWKGTCVANKIASVFHINGNPGIMKPHTNTHAHTHTHTEAQQKLKTSKQRGRAKNQKQTF